MFLSIIEDIKKARLLETPFSNAALHMLPVLGALFWAVPFSKLAPHNVTFFHASFYSFKVPLCARRWPREGEFAARPSLRDGLRDAV